MSTASTRATPGGGVHVPDGSVRMTTLSTNGGYGYYGGQAFGGFGGGAAYGNNGGDALGNPSAEVYNYYGGTPYEMVVTCGRGGNGANALPPPQTTVYGRGGTSGNGGGAVGQWHYAFSQQDKLDSLPASPASRPVILNFAGGTYSDTTPPTPGTGSDGGKGGDGCIILYYREPVTP